MMRRVKQALLPMVATMMVIAGMTAGVTANSGLQLPSWGSGAGSELVAGPLGLNPTTGGGTVPMAIQIPDATVDAEVEQNQIVDGVMLDPSGPWVVSWYQETALLGEIDNVVMSGHIDYWDVGPAVFYTVAQLGDNAPIHVTGKDGSKYTYAVEWVKTYDVAGLTKETINEIVGPTDYRALTLITCGGEFNGEEYLSRTVVRARLVDAEVVTDAGDPEAAASESGETAETAQQQANDETAPDDQAPAGLAIGGTATVTQDGLNLRVSATINSDVVTTLAAGQQLTIIGGPQDADGFTWWQVQLADGAQGWVAADFLQP